MVSVQERVMMASVYLKSCNANMYLMCNLPMRVNKKTPGSLFLEITYNKTTRAPYKYRGFLGGFLGAFCRTLMEGSHIILSIFTTDCHCNISLNWSFKQFHKLSKAPNWNGYENLALCRPKKLYINHTKYGDLISSEASETRIFWIFIVTGAALALGSIHLFFWKNLFYLCKLFYFYLIWWNQWNKRNSIQIVQNYDLF